MVGSIFVDVREYGLNIYNFFKNKYIIGYFQKLEKKILKDYHSKKHRTIFSDSLKIGSIFWTLHRVFELLYVSNLEYFFWTTERIITVW